MTGAIYITEVCSLHCANQGLCQSQVDHLLIQTQISNESVELEELREMKADVERREKAQAAVLERQAKRLEELETLYKVNH